MAPLCPRCQIQLTAEAQANGEAEVHRCARCRGLWVDHVEVAWVSPALAWHGSRVEELIAHGARRTSAIGRCPRGHERTLEFPFFDLWLDVCEECHGLWIDGDEERFVKRAGQHEDGLEDRPRGESAYRGGTDGAGVDRVTCHACEKQVHPRRTYLSADGPVCDDCVEIEGMAEALGDDTVKARVLRGPRRLLKLLGDLLDADGKRLKRGGFTNWGG